MIDKGIPGSGLLASFLTDKYLDHMPLYRQKQRFARENIPIASSTIEGWAKEALIMANKSEFDGAVVGYGDSIVTFLVMTGFLGVALCKV